MGSDTMAVCADQFALLDFYGHCVDRFSESHSGRDIELFVADMVEIHYEVRELLPTVCAWLFFLRADELGDFFSGYSVAVSVVLSIGAIVGAALWAHFVVPTDSAFGAHSTFAVGWKHLQIQCLFAVLADFHGE